MSAQGSPYASGPYPPHQEHPSKGANPLRRTSDRIEAWFFRFLMLVFAVGLPVASVSGGLTAYDSAMRTVQAQSAERHQITARLSSAPEGALGSAGDEKRRAQVSWTDKDGKQRTGTARVPQGTTAGSVVRIWVDREGTVKNAPMSVDNATATGWLVGGMTAVGVFTGVFAARRGIRLVMDRRKYAQWDSDWDMVEPLWSARFRRLREDEGLTGAEEGDADVRGDDHRSVRGHDGDVVPAGGDDRPGKAFSLFVRDMPPDRCFLVAAGLESSLDFLSGFRVGLEDVDAFASALHRPPRDLAPLLGMESTGEVRGCRRGG